MEEVKDKVKEVEWSNTVQKIDSNYCRFPILVKPTAETASTYSISENDIILLHHVLVDQRIVAQSLEDEGAYVVGTQLEIPSEYTGTFKYRHDIKRDIEPIRTFSSVREIAASLPRHVFPQESIVVYPPTTSEPHNGSAEKERSIILPERAQLTVIEKKMVNATVVNSRFQSSYLEQMFKTKPKTKLVAVSCLSVRNELTKEILNLPLSTRGKFATVSHIPAHNRELSFKDILTAVDLPITLSICRNCPRTLLDEALLRPGMNLRMTSIEEHEMILGATLSQKIIEFASDGASFFLSKHTDGNEEEEMKILYQTALQRFLMECEMKNSPINIKEYKRSMHNHIARTVRPTHPTVLNQVASLRVSRYSENKSLLSNGVSVIQLLAGNCTEPHRFSLPVDNLDMHTDQSLLRVRTACRTAPEPPPPLPEGFDEQLPPLPPRNIPTMNRNSRHSSLSPRRKRQDGRPLSFAGSSWNDYPKRAPPPLPPKEDNVKTPDHSVIMALDEVDQSNSTEENIWVSVDQVRKMRRSLKQEQENAVTGAFEVSESDIEVSTAENDPIHENIVLVEDSSSISEASPNTISATNDLNLRSLDSPTFDKVYENRDVGVISTSPVSTHSTLSNEYFVTDGSQASCEDINASVLPADGENFEECVVKTENEDEEPESECGTDSLHNDCFRLTEYVVKDGRVTASPSFTCNYIPPPENWTPPDDLTTISVTEVANSLRFIGMNEDTVEWFSAEKVDGELLCSVDNDMLKQHFHLTPFQQKKLLMFMLGWRPKLD